MADSAAGTQWSRRSEAATALPKAVRFAATSCTGATKLLLRTWASAITTPQANVTDRRKGTTALVFLLVASRSVQGHLHFTNFEARTGHATLVLSGLRFKVRARPAGQPVDVARGTPSRSGCTSARRMSTVAIWLRRPLPPS